MFRPIYLIIEYSIFRQQKNNDNILELLTNVGYELVCNSPQFFDQFSTVENRIFKRKDL